MKKGWEACCEAIRMDLNSVPDFVACAAGDAVYTKVRQELRYRLMLLSNFDAFSRAHSTPHGHE